MKKVLIGILTGVLLVSSPVSAKEEIEQLYAQSAVLMDADNGRVLFEKNGSEKKPMASTTKIMTCILALEEGNLTDVVNVSENAARQPKVHLGMQMDEKFYLRDLLYSLMLESHNDSAVAIAEHIGGSVQAFADKMNAKAKEIGCRDTYFITPNGLDASDDNGEHFNDSGRFGQDHELLYFEISEEGELSFNYSEGKLSFYGCRLPSFVFLPESQCVFDNDGWSVIRKDRIYREGGVLLCRRA